MSTGSKLVSTVFDQIIWLTVKGEDVDKREVKRSSSSARMRLVVYLEKACGHIYIYTPVACVYANPLKPVLVRDWCLLSS